MKIKHLIFGILSICLLVSCGDRALFDELAENRIKVVIKGTYESNDPRDWITAIPPNDNESMDDLADDSAFNIEVTDSGGVNEPNAFMFDVAGLKISSGRHTQNFANYRKTYTCSLDDTDPFFNGTGVLYKNDDVRPDFKWETLQMFIRKMVINGANEYSVTDYDTTLLSPVWKFSKIATTTFHEETVNGSDFNHLMLNTYYDFLLSNHEDVNRIFPLVIAIEDGLYFDNDAEETTLEVRLVLKNFIKKYEYDYTDAGVQYVQHYYAPSDWLRDVHADENVIGGNLIACARVYVKGRTANITGSANPGTYVIAINSKHDISEYTKTTTTRPGTLSSTDINDEPKAPHAPVSTSIESVLDYYLKYEEYKNNKDIFINSVDDSTYADSWNDYNTDISAFKIPPIITWTDSGTFTLTNIPVGDTYRIYQSAGIANAELPSSFTYIDEITVTELDADDTLNL